MVNGMVDKAKDTAASWLGVPPGAIDNWENMTPQQQQQAQQLMQSPERINQLLQVQTAMESTDPTQRQQATDALIETLHGSGRLQPLLESFQNNPRVQEAFQQTMSLSNIMGEPGSWLKAFQSLPMPIQMLIGGGLMSMVGGMFGGGQGAAVGGLLGAGAAAFAPQLMGMMNQQEDPAAAATGQAPPAPNSAAPQMQFGAPPAGEPLPLDNIDPNTGLPPQAGMEQNGGLLPPGSWGGMQ